MDLRQLRYFVGIIQAGSLSRAASQLHVAQSALSHHLGALESELGRDLVARGPKGVRLTESGTVLYRHAEAILRHVEFAKEDAKSALSIPSGRVSIGFPAVLAGILGCALLRQIRNTYPQILLHVSDANGWVIRERLLNGALDIAVLFADKSERGLAVEPLLVEELLYFTADADPSPIRIAEVARRPLLVSGPKGSCRRVAEAAFKKHGLSVVPSDEIDALGTLRNAIASGIGNSILPWCALYDGERRTTLNFRRIADAKLVRTVSLCFSEVVERTPAIEATALTLKALVRELVESGTWQGVSPIAPSREPADAPAARQVVPTS
jgi:LysR family transcriptional regulator, nitrogen assimilation regulatory protein